MPCTVRPGQACRGWPLTFGLRAGPAAVYSLLEQGNVAQLLATQINVPWLPKWKRSNHRCGSLPRPVPRIRTPIQASSAVLASTKSVEQANDEKHNQCKVTVVMGSWNFGIESFGHSTCRLLFLDD